MSADAGPDAPFPPTSFPPASPPAFPGQEAPEPEADADAEEEFQSIDGQMGGAGKRSFTVVAANHGKNGGRYMSATPMAAAKKAGRQLFNEAKKTIRTIHFVVRETTRGSAKKEFKYVITKHKLAKAKTIERGGVKVHVHHEYAISADK
jgi:hypothetical protein